MTELEIAHLPGIYAMRLVFWFFDVETHAIPYELFNIFAAITALVFWVTLLRLTWMLILRILNVRPNVPPHSNRPYR